MRLWVFKGITAKTDEIVRSGRRIKMLENMTMRESMVSGLLGLVVGEAAGIPFLLTKRSAMKDHPMTGLNGPENSLAWGEVTALSLATMDSIVKTGRIDFNDTMDRFLDWLENRKYCPPNPVRNEFANTTITVQYAIMRYKNGKAPLICGAYAQNETGAAPMMRVLPVACYSSRKVPDRVDRLELMNHVSSLTHATEPCWLGCLILADYVDLLLNGFGKTEALQRLQEYDYRKYYTDESCDEFLRILSGEILSLEERDIHSSAYIVYVLEAGLWCILNTDSYQDAIIQAVNLGGATNYVAAITGALAGILYGRKGIPLQWINRMQSKSYLTDEIYRFVNTICGKSM